MPTTPSQQLIPRLRSKPGVTIIDLYGDITIFAEKALNTAYSEASGKNTSTILLNFSHVDYINSSGIASIVCLLTKARKSHQQLIVCGLSDHYIEIFQITGLVNFITIFPDEASALQSQKSR